MFRTPQNWLTSKTPRVAGAPQTAKHRRKPAWRTTMRPVLEELETRLVPAGTWAALANQPSDSVGTMILLSDGSIMAQHAGCSKDWFKLTPGSNGGYASSGTWSDLSSMNLERLFFGSNVLHDGRVFILGGEYSGSSGDENDTNAGEIYDTSTNTWASIANFPETKFGDDPTMLLNNGQILSGYIFGPQTFLYDPISNTWTQTNGSKLHNSDRSDEETWLKLPDGSVLSYDVFNDVEHGQSTAQRYVPATGLWVDAGTVPVDLSSSALGDELGGATLLPDGRAWFVGATGHTAFYTPSSNTWTAGPDLPNSQQADDAPLCQMPNGHVLVAADGPTGKFSPPTHIYDFDPVANTFAEVDPPPLANNNSVMAFTCRMLALPSGQVLLEQNNSDQLFVYTPDSGPGPSWKPTITGITNHQGFGLAPELVLTGTQLNGISAGASYGDDAEMDSNYPIVEYVDHASHIHFAQGFDRSSNGVQTGSTLLSTSYILPQGITDGAFRVQVSANGIFSSAVLNVLMDASLNTVTLEIDSNNSSLYDVFKGSTLLSQWSISSFSAVDVTVQKSGGTVSILSTPAGVPVNVYGDGTATINIGKSGSLLGIQGPVDLENPTSFNTINIDDSLDTAQHTVTLTSVTATTILNGSAGLAGQVTGLAPATITWRYLDTAHVIIQGGTGSNVWNVLGTGANTNIVAGGDDTVNVGNAGSVQNITGTLNLENPAFFNTLIINDSNDFNARAASIGTLASNPDDFAGGASPWGQVSGLAPGVINFEYADTASVTVQTGSAVGNLVNVLGTGVRTNVVGNFFGTTVIVGNVGSLGAILGTVNVENPANQTNLTVDGSSDTAARTVTLSNIGTNPDDFGGGLDFWGQISGLAPAPINYEYADTNNLTLSLNSAANTVNIQATGGTGTTTVNARGNTTVVVTNAGTTQGIATPLALAGPSHSIALSVNGSADTAIQTVTVNTTSLTGMMPAALTFTASQLSSILLQGGSSAEVYNVESSAIGTPITINAGIGNDTFNLSPAAKNLGNLAALVNVIGGGGNNALHMNDQNAPGAETYTVSASAVSRAGSGGVSYRSAQSLSINSGNHGNTFTVGTTSPALTLNGGTGVDTLIGPNVDSNWTVSSAGGGKVGTLTFSKFENLTGGSGVDVFKFTKAGSLSGAVNGGRAPLHKGNWLDYSGLTGTVTVNLLTGAASGVARGAAGKVTNVQNVHGGDGGNTLNGNAQGNVLIGGTGADTIVGGTGASLLIGDNGADQVTGGSGGDILIGDLTTFDAMTTANETALMSILAEWQSADSYATRFHDINSGTGGGLNGTAMLNFGKTVKDDAFADTVTAAVSNQALDWFFQGIGDILQNLESGEHVNNR